MSTILVCEYCNEQFKAAPSRLKRRPHRFCSRTCRSAFSRRPEAIAARFWKSVDRSAGPDACWPWTGGKDRDGYGRVWHNGKTNRGAHCLAYELANGAYAETHDGQPTEIMHACDNPPCCNPAHLKIGNALLNRKEQYERGRGLEGQRNGRYKHGRRSVPKNTGLQAALVTA